MHSSPHPNQVRSACERCRRQKLRCSRPTAPEASCARCSRLSLPCQSGSQRRVGRPPKRDLVQRKPSGNNGIYAGATPAGEGVGGGVVDDIQFLDGLFDDSVPGLEWTMTTNSSLTFESQDLLPSMDPFLIPKELPPPPPSQLAITKNIHFETLSRLNVDIHKSYDTISKFVATQTFEDFICMQFDAMNGYENIKMVVKSAQEFLVVIKALHRQMGVKVVSRLGAHDPLALTMDPELLGVPTPSTDTSDNIDDDDAFPSHDAPTMFLVISCYVQLIKHLELVFNLVHSRITDKATAPPNPAPMMSFADVPLIEASTQFVLFCELVSHVLGQINLVLGLPSPWAERSVWIGLLKGRRYREMVNAELGSVEGGVWTERPGRLMDKARATKELFAECSMMGF